MSLEPLSGSVPLPESVLEIARALESAGHETWCVGGALRDWRLAPESPLLHDVDLATAALPDQVQRLFPRTVAVGVKYGTVGVLDRKGVLHEVTTFRKDVSTDGRHAVVEYGVSIEEDLARRDFTINALAYHPIRAVWLDPFGGAEDLGRGVVRAVGNPTTRFAEDYLRILRMARFAARFRFEIAPATWSAAVAAAPGLAQLSAERVRDEWFKGLQSASSRKHFVDLWRRLGATATWLPELMDPYPLAEPSPAPAIDPVVVTAGVCARPGAVLRRLRASNAEIARAEAIDRAPKAPVGTDVVAVRRWLALAGGAADDLLQLALLRTGQAPPWWGPMVDGIRARGEATSRPQLAVTGDDLVAAGVSAGPELGRLLGRLLDRVLEDPACNTREALLALVHSWR